MHIAGMARVREAHRPAQAMLHRQERLKFKLSRKGFDTRISMGPVMMSTLRRLRPLSNSRSSGGVPKAQAQQVLFQHPSQKAKHCVKDQHRARNSR